jgi:hypothetical protein
MYPSKMIGYSWPQLLTFTLRYFYSTPSTTRWLLMKPPFSKSSFPLDPELRVNPFAFNKLLSPTNVQRHL